VNYKDIVIKPIVSSLEVLDISDEEYFHGDRLKGYISNSKLNLIDPSKRGSPELFKEGLGFSVSDSFYFGSAVHSVVLQPESYHIVRDFDRPTAKAGFMADELYEAFKKKRAITYADGVAASKKIGYYVSSFTLDKYNALLPKVMEYIKARWKYEKKELISTPIYLDAKSRLKLDSCIESIKNNNEIQSLLTDSLGTKQVFNEATIIVDVECSLDEKTVVLHLKGKLDNYTVDKITNTIVLNDLKTTGHLIEDFKDKSFFKYSYYRQMAMYGWLLNIANQKIYKIKDMTFKSNMLLVSTIPTFKTGVFKVGKRHIKIGIEEFSDLLKRVAYLEMYG